jgi:transposase
MNEQSLERLKAPLKSSLADQIEIKVRRERRRRWTQEDKVRIVNEMLAPGAVALKVAERNEISTGLLFTWRRQLMADAQVDFVPVQITAPMSAVAASEPKPVQSDSVIEIDLPGGARVRAGVGVDFKLLRLVLTTLDGR